jgi:hypothetical protein
MATKNNDTWSSKDAIVISQRVEALHDIFQQPDKFAQHLVNTLRKSKEADEEIKKLL